MAEDLESVGDGQLPLAALRVPDLRPPNHVSSAASFEASGARRWAGALVAGQDVGA